LTLGAAYAHRGFAAGGQHLKFEGLGSTVQSVLHVQALDMSLLSGLHIQVAVCDENGEFREFHFRAEQLALIQVPSISKSWIAT
jgi:hypothetical protein